MGTAMKPQQMVDLLEEHIVGQVRTFDNNSVGVPAYCFTYYIS